MNVGDERKSKIWNEEEVKNKKKRTREREIDKAKGRNEVKGGMEGRDSWSRNSGYEE
jgi:hypothetical protein